VASQPYTKSESNAAEPLDPWAVSAPAATEVAPVETISPSPEAPEAEATEETSVQDDAAFGSTAETETIEPTPADSTDSEIKFATSDTNATADHSADKTITLDVGPRGKNSTKPATARTPRPAGLKSELMPVLVTPRQVPQAELAKQENAEPVEEEVAPQPTPARQQPTLAKQPPVVAEESIAIQAAPIQAVPTPVAVKSGPSPIEVSENIENARKLVAAPSVEAAPQAVAESAEPVEVKSEPVAKSEPAAIIKLVPIPVEAPSPKVEVAAIPSIPPTAVAVAEPVAVAKAPLTAPTPVAVAPSAESAAPAASTPVVRQAPKATEPIAAAAPAPAPVAAAVPAPVAAQALAAAPGLPQATLPQVAAVRSPAMVATLARADERVRHAIQLAEKGAMYASRKEFTAAISAIAQAHDVEHGTRQFSQATSAGFQALKEAGEFNATGEVDVRRLVAGHKTPVLKQFDVSDLPPTLAAQHYYNYAKEQLAAGVGRETVGSIALYGLAKIVIAGAGANAQQLEYTGPAMALYQAALICEPQNFRAAHELGVLLAGSGQLELARDMLMGSVASSPQPVMLKNLAVVHSRLGEQQQAADAQQKANVLTQTSPNTNTPNVQWVDPATFASMGAGADPANPPTATANPQGAAPGGSEPTKTPANVARKRTTEWNPLNLRR
jgi:tetratricopeptide (TPR) repeat protein